jgi:hypothetical protein
MLILQPPAPRESSTKPAHVLRVYDLEGNPKRDVIARIGNSACGPRVDAAGNLYVAAACRPGSARLPAFFQDRLPPIRKDKAKGWYVPPETFPYSWGYGSIVKFSPAGGQVLWPVDSRAKEYADHYKPWTGDVAGAVRVAFFRQSSSIRMQEAPGSGVLWAHLGMYPVTTSVGCNCLASYFDVDACGRVFFPDAARCRVSVLDAAGNVIGHFGRYGNRDAEGRDDYVPLAMPIAVAATDRFCYVGDINNQQLVRTRLEYGLRQTCNVQ